MAVTKVLARDWTIEIDTDPLATTPTGSPVWTEIKGLNTIGFSQTKNDADVTTFDSGGFLEHIPASRGYEVTLEGIFLEDVSTGDRDPGQEAVEEYADMVGAEALASFQLTSPGGTIWSFSGSVTVETPSGGNDDPTGWSATITVSGQITKA